MPTIVLHQWEISPFCGKVRRILEHKQLAFTVENYNGIKGRHAAKLSAVGKLPVLDYDGERIQDSSDIAEFLEAKHPAPPVFPRDPVERAQAHFWEDWADESLYWFEVYFRFMDADAATKSIALLAAGRPSFERMLLGRVVKKSHKKALHGQGLGRLTRDRVVAKFCEHLDQLDAILTKQPFLVGSERSIADIAVQSQLAEVQRTSTLAAEIEKRARLSAWLNV
ncbi:MAG: glutathione S-transferase family protein [Kofleriaceae bacterium]